MLKYKLFKIVPRWFLLFLLLFIVVFFILPRLLFAYNYEITYGTYKRESEIRGTRIIVFTYQVDRTEYENNFNVQLISKNKLMQFKKGGKLKVKYVKLLPFLSKLDETEFTN